MTKIKYLIFAGLILLCISQKAWTASCQSVSEFQWMVGDWFSDLNGSVMFEHWHNLDSQNMQGRAESYSFGNQKPAFIETLRLVEMSGAIFFIAKVPQNPLPVSFSVASCEKGRVVFENPSHDFPKKIEYQQSGNNNLTATIYGNDGPEFSVSYQRQSNLKTIRAFIEAFNEQHLEKMLAFASENIRWYSMIEGNAVLETQGKKALSQAMSQYFNRGMSSRSQLLTPVSDGNFINGIEKVFWKKGATEMQSCAPVKYEVVRGKITNVWYFEAKTC